MSSTEDRVRRIVCEQLGVGEEEVTTSASFIDDLGADSLGYGRACNGFRRGIRN